MKITPHEQDMIQGHLKYRFAIALPITLSRLLTGVNEFCRSMILNFKPLYLYEYLLSKTKTFYHKEFLHSK